MKKVLAILSLLVFLPFSVYALEMIHDDAMDNVTGQAGISIDLVGMSMNINLGAINWNDYDGIPGMTGGIMTAVGAFHTGATFPIGVDGTGSIHGTQITGLTVNGGITIDVGQDTGALLVTSAVPYMGAQPFLRIGTSGSLNVGIASIDTYATGDINVTNLAMAMTMQGIDIGGMTNPLTGMPTDGVAINMVSGMTINSLTIASAAWGDLDGIVQNDLGVGTGDNNPGYIGIIDLNVLNLPISQGGITIECGTDTTLGASTAAGDPEETKLKIGISALSIGNAAPMGGTYVGLRLQTGTTAALGGAKGVNELGAVFINGMNITINAGSEVYIYAH